MRRNPGRTADATVEASDGLQALELSGGFAGEIDLVITDVVVPLLGGRELGEHMARLRPNARVLYISGYAESTAEREWVQGASIPFLQKPFSMARLLEKVRQVLVSPARGGCAPPQPTAEAIEEQMPDQPGAA